jgi:hypothetical protein
MDGATEPEARPAGDRVPRETYHSQNTPGGHMDGPQHYTEAERLLKRAQDEASDKDFYREQDAGPTLLAALAHAVLANAAAVAVGGSTLDSSNWQDVAGSPAGSS